MKTGSHVQSHINKYAKKDISQMYKDFNISDDGYNDQQVRFNRDIYGMNIGDKKIKPKVNPVPFPNALESLIHWIIERTIAAITLINGINRRITNNGFNPTIWYITTVLYIGINEAQPGLPALVNIFHIAITEST